MEQIFKFPNVNEVAIFKIFNIDVSVFTYRMGGGPRVVVSTAAFHARVRGSVPGLGG